MSAFWAGFEKQAVSLNWAQNKVRNGLATRASATPSAAKALLKKSPSKEAIRHLQAEQGFSKKQLSGPWRKLEKTKKGRQSRIDEVRRINQSTKNNPRKARTDFNDLTPDSMAKAPKI